jgi:type IV fimbrial biogenesis protein FimT
MNHARSAGLTLLELMIAMVILATLVGMATPSFSAVLGRHRLKAAAEHLAGDVAEARLEAARRGSAVHLNFQTGEQWCYVLTTSVDGGCAGSDSGRLKRVVAADHPGLKLADAMPMVLDGSGASGALLPGHALFVTARDEALQVRLSRLGRASACSPGASLPGATPC